MARDTRPTGSMGDWIRPVAAVVVLQSTSAFLVQLLPVLSTVVSAERGWSSGLVGYFTAVSMAASIAYLVLVYPATRRVGPVASMRIGLAAAVVGVLILLLPGPAAPMVASALIGIAYGSAMPAGSRVLQRFAPPERRSLVFSVRQASVPMGASLAGAILPLATVAGGWPASLVIAAGISLLAIASTGPAQSAIDRSWKGETPDDQGRNSGTGPLGPIRTVFEVPGVGGLAVLGGCMAAAQSAWTVYLVTFLTLDAGQDLVVAGLLFATMQISAIVSRVAVGWTADRFGCGQRILRLLAVTSLATSIAIVFVAPSVSAVTLFLMMIVAGASLSGWNGLHLAELATRSPDALVGDVSAGGLVVVLVGLMGGPFLAATLTAAFGSVAAALVAVAVLPAVAAAGLVTADLLRPPASPAV